jgi:hypothetical protein
MRQKIFFFTFILGFILLFEGLLFNPMQKDNNSAYLTIIFQNPMTFNDSTSQNTIKSNIERVFENEGIHIIHKEKPEEYKLKVIIIIRDSLIIESKDMSLSGQATYTVKKPRIAYQYKSKEEIYNSVKSYIKKYLK